VERRPHGRRTRVVFVDHVARLSGGEIALMRLLPALARDVDVHVILGEEGPLVDRLRSADIRTDVLPLAPEVRDLRKATVRPGALDPRALVRLPRYVARLARRLRTLDADIVHTNSLKAALYGGAAARLARVPVVWHVRDRIAPDYLPRSAVTLVRAASHVLPTAIVANSRATLETLPRTRRQSVVYNPVVPDGIERVRPEGQDADRIATVGIVGRLAEWKGQHVFLEAFAEAFGGTDVHGRIVGSALFGEDAYSDGLRRRAEELGISGQIEFRGFREDVWAELRELDLLAHCSIVPEPFGQVVLEAMAAGLPVIASNAGGPAELITDGTDGILVRPGDARSLAAALVRLRDDPRLCSSLGRAAQRRAAAFTPERTAEALRVVYDGVLADRRPVGSARRQHAKQLVRRTIGEPYVGKRLKMRSLARYLDSHSLRPNRILDAGSEDATFVYWLADRYPGATVTAIDIDEAAIASCLAARPSRYAERVDFVAGTFASLPERVFDLVMAFDVLEHIEDDRQAAAQLAATLRPGGTLLVHVPRDRWRTWDGTLHHVADEDAWRINLGHVRQGYSPERLRGLLEGAGLEVRLVETWLGRWGVLAHSVYARLERPTPLRLLSVPVTDICSALDRRSPTPDGNTVFAAAVRL
jgi:glycosyltransferase involved in cell wall biosynthesis